MKLTCVLNQLAGSEENHPLSEETPATGVCGEAPSGKTWCERGLWKYWSSSWILGNCAMGVRALQKPTGAHSQPASGPPPHQWKCQPIAVGLQSINSQQGENGGQDQLRDVCPFLYISPPWLPPTQGSWILDPRRGGWEWQSCKDRADCPISKSLEPKACPVMEGKKGFEKDKF